MKACSVACIIFCLSSTAVMARSNSQWSVAVDYSQHTPTGSIGEEPSLLLSMGDSKQTEWRWQLGWNNRLVWVPNFALTTSQVESQNNAILTSTFRFDDTVFNIASPVQTDTSMSQTNLLGWYQWYRSRLFDVKAGLGLQNSHLKVDIVDAYETNNRAQRDVINVDALAYISASTHMPLVAMALEWQWLGNASDHYETSISLHKLLFDGQLMQSKVEAGIRQYQWTYDNLTDLYVSHSGNAAFVKYVISF